MHLGETFGVTPNPNATRPATVAAIGNPYGGMQGPAIAPHGVVGSTGIGNGLEIGIECRHGGQGGLRPAFRARREQRSELGPGGQRGLGGHSAGDSRRLPIPQQVTAPAITSLEVISKPPVQYTGEARQLRVQGDVVLRVTFTAAGQVVVQGVVHGLGHGLDEEARRVAQQIRFRPATRNGQAVDLTTNITITFQLA